MIWLLWLVLFWMACLIVSQVCALLRAKRQVLEIESRMLDYQLEILAALMRDTDRRLKKKLTVVKKGSE